MEFETINENKLESVIINFIAELEPDINILWNIIEIARKMNEGVQKYLVGNILSILNKINKSVLAGKDLSSLSIKDTNLNSADLKLLI
jgi:hypothetical protein